MTDERVLRYGKVIWETSRADEGTISATGANIVARAVMAVADAELADAEVEIARVRGRLREEHTTCVMRLMEAEQDRDEWKQSTIAANRRAEAAVDALRTLRERVAGLADEWGRHCAALAVSGYVGSMTYGDAVARLRAALAEAAPALPSSQTSGAGCSDPPAEATPPAECGAKHPTNSSVVPCVVTRGHRGLHMSTTGCAGSVTYWAATPPAEPVDATFALDDDPRAPWNQP